MAKKAQVQIELEEGGRILSPFSQLIIEQHFDWHHSFELRMAMHAFTGNSQSFSDTCQKIIGKPMKVGLNSLTDSSAEDNFFKGIITDISMSRAHGTTNEVVIRGYSPTILLDDGPNSRYFEEMGVSQIANQVLSSYPTNILKNQVGTVNDAIPYTVQYQESNYNFLCRLAERNGEWFFYDGTELKFGKPTGNKAADLLLGKDLYHFDLGLKLEAPNFKLTAHDYIKHTDYNADASSSNVPGLNSFGKFLMQASEDVYNQKPLHMHHMYVDNQSKLNDIAKRRKSYQASGMVNLSGQSDNIGIRIGKTIDISASFGDVLSDKKEEHKSYLVYQITHWIDGQGNYQNQFNAIPSSLTTSPKYSHITYPVPEVQSALVVDNNDPDKLGRVRVKFFWMEDGGLSPWIRYMQTHAGKDNGFYFLPEIDEEVLVSFIANDPERPIVVGSLYHKQNLPHDSWIDEKNEVKAIKTRSGNEIKFTDKKDSEEITIFNAEKQNEITLSLSGDGSITIKSEGQINISAAKAMKIDAETIDIKAEKDITVDCKNLKVFTKEQITMDATKAINLKSKTDSVSVKAMKDFTANATNNATVKATAQLALEGTAGAKLSGLMTTVEGKTTVDVKANAMLNLKGTAMANLQGALVKIN